MRVGLEVGGQRWERGLRMLRRTGERHVAAMGTRLLWQAPGDFVSFPAVLAASLCFSLRRCVKECYVGAGVITRKGSSNTLIQASD